MDTKDRLCSGPPINEFPNQISSVLQSFSQQQKWEEDSSILDYGISNEPSFTEYNNLSEIATSLSGGPNDPIKILDQAILQASKNQDWDPRVMLNNLSLLEQKIHKLQDLVHLIVSRRGQVTWRPDELFAQQQQLITADLTSIIVQLISTAGSLLPSVKDLSNAQLNGFQFSSGKALKNPNVFNQSSQVDFSGTHRPEQNYVTEEHELKDEDDVEEGEHLPPGTYEILQLEKDEILAPHTHFCTICGKGFKRDANLRMHMRGHGDEYKSPAALAKPYKEANSEPMLIKRYSCPYSGCKRNKEHKKFQPLKTILCVKNHYKRTHCDKSYMCCRCNTKKFSVIADLKTHEKHCGRDKWLCSCGTTFSRKDKLFGHIGLFQGHTPAILFDEKGSVGVSDRGESNTATNKIENIGFDFNSNALMGNEMQNVMGAKENLDDVSAYFSPMTFDTSSLSGYQEFPRTTFGDSVSSFSFLMPGSSNYAHITEGKLDSNDLQ